MQLKQYFADKRSFYHFKDAHREKAASNNISSLSKIIEYGHSGGWYIKSTIYTRFLS